MPILLCFYLSKTYVMHDFYLYFYKSAVNRFKVQIIWALSAAGRCKIRAMCRRHQGSALWETMETSRAKHSTSSWVTLNFESTFSYLSLMSRQGTNISPLFFAALCPTLLHSCLLFKDVGVYPAIQSVQKFEAVQWFWTSLVEIVLHTTHIIWLCIYKPVWALMICNMQMH